VSHCNPHDKAACTVVFTNPSNGNFQCYESLDECTPHVGGAAGLPGTKQSTCAEYD
jgi:hypothetical protein